VSQIRTCSAGSQNIFLANNLGLVKKTSALRNPLIFTRKPTSTHVSHATEGVQWIRMEELGKALTNRCRVVRELSNKKQKNLTGTRDGNVNSEQLEFACQLRTPTRGRIYELLSLGASSSHNLFQSLITTKTC